MCGILLVMEIVDGVHTYFLQYCLNVELRCRQDAPKICSRLMRFRSLVLVAAVVEKGALHKYVVWNGIAF